MQYRSAQSFSPVNNEHRQAFGGRKWLAKARRVGKTCLHLLSVGRQAVVKRSVRGLLGLPVLADRNLRRRVVQCATVTRRLDGFPVGVPAMEDWHLPVRPAEVLQRQAPTSLDEADAARFRASSLKYQNGCVYETPPVSLACLHGAHIYSDDLLVLTRDRRVLLESALAREEVLEKNGLLDRLMHPRVVRKPGTYALLSNPWADGYYHWLMDALPKLSLLEPHAELNTVPLVVHRPFRDYQRATLTALGIGAGRVVPFDGGCWQVDRLYCPTLLSGTGNPSPQAVAWLRERFLGGPEAGSPRGRRFYVTRRDAKQRRVVNEGEVIDCLRDLGFTVVCPGDLSFAQQVELFREADVVVAAHGAGCTNMVFAPVGATLVELFGENYINGCYWALTNIRKQRYGFLTGPNTDRLDYVVSIERLRQLLVHKLSL